MSFKKLNPLLKEALLQQGYSKPLPFQKEILPKLKGGANVYGIAPKGFGKTDSSAVSWVTWRISEMPGNRHSHDYSCLR